MRLFKNVRIVPVRLAWRGLCWQAVGWSNEWGVWHYTTLCPPTKRLDLIWAKLRHRHRAGARFLDRRTRIFK